MSKALEDWLMAGHTKGGRNLEAATLLRQQHEALKVALEALEKSLDNFSANNQHLAAIKQIKELL